MKFLAIIPARYASTRFPAKPLVMLDGKTIIQRVYEQVAGVLDDAVVAGNPLFIKAPGIKFRHHLTFGKLAEVTAVFGRKESHEAT